MRLFFTLLIVCSMPLGLAASNKHTVAAAEEIIVIGQRPGPQLWKVESKTGVLWILGTLSPLPESLEWDSSSVKWIISQADEFLGPPGIYASVSSPIAGISAYRKYQKLRKNPNGGKLNSLLEPDLLTKLMAAIDQFKASKRKTLRLRPSFAAEQLHQDGFKTVGLTDDKKITKALRKIAKRSKVKVTDARVKIDIEKGLSVLADTTMDAEIECLNQTLNALNTDLDASLERALAWVNGDTQLLTALDYPDLQKSCFNNLYTASVATQAREQSMRQWLKNASEALEKNEVTFAYLAVSHLVRPDGLLAKLASLGYKIN